MKLKEYLMKSAYHKMVPDDKRQLIEQYSRESADLSEFVKKLAKLFNVENSPVIDAENIPAEGPLVIAANHPFGLKDGIKICLEVLKKRDDIKILVRDDFQDFNVAGFENLFLYINKSGNKDLLRSQNEKINDHVSKGKSLLIFGTGLVEKKNISGEFVDQAWKKLFVNIAKKTNANVLPVSVGGNLPHIFYVLDQLKMTSLALFFLLRLNFKHTGPVSLKFFDSIGIDEINNTNVNDFLLKIKTMVDRQTKRFNDELSLNDELPLESNIKVEGVSKVSSKINETLNLMSPEAQKKYLDENAIVQKEGMALRQTFYLLPPNEEFANTEFCKQLVHERCRSFSLCKEATDEELAGKTNTLDNRFYQAIIFDETDGIACGYRINLLKDKSVEDMYNSDLFEFSDEFSDEFKDVSLELGRSFMNASYSESKNGKKGALSFNNMFKGLHRTIRYFHEEGISIENLIGSLSFSSQLGEGGPEVIQAYQNEFSVKDMGYEVRANNLKEELSTSKDVRSIKEITDLVPKDKKALVTLVKHYFDLVDDGHAFAGPAIKNEIRNCHEMYIHISLKGIKSKKDEKFGDGEYSIREALSDSNS